MTPILKLVILVKMAIWYFKVVVPPAINVDILSVDNHVVEE